MAAAESSNCADPGADTLGPTGVFLGIGTDSMASSNDLVERQGVRLGWVVHERANSLVRIPVSSNDAAEILSPKLA